MCIITNCYANPSQLTKKINCISGGCKFPPLKVQIFAPFTVPTYLKGGPTFYVSELPTENLKT